MIREKLSLPEPERTKALESLSKSDAVDVFSPREFKTKYCGEIKSIKKGKNTVSMEFGIFLLREFDELSESPVGEETQKAPEDDHSDYFKKLVEIKGIGEKSAEEIEKAFPSPAELVEAVKTDRLPDQLVRFKDTFLEVFK
jgi:hypothetical protein